MLKYKGYKIDGSSIPMYMSGCESLGTVYRNGRAESIIEVARIEGKIFNTMKEAEAHGLELGREWVHNRTERSGPIQA
jgi:hypothetical protein